MPIKSKIFHLLMIIIKPFITLVEFPKNLFYIYRNKHFIPSFSNNIQTKIVFNFNNNCIVFKIS